MAREEFQIEESSAPFNMALATLYALRNILADIKNIEANPYFADDQKQKFILKLLKRFYVDSSPLIEDEKIIEKYTSILDLKMEERKIIIKGKVTSKKKTIYSEELQKQIDTYLIKLQIELQKKKYYMPPRRDLGKAVGDFR